MRKLRWIPAVLLFAACELPPEPTLGGDDVLVVEAVLRAGEPLQRVVLHRGLQSRVAGGVPGADVVVIGPRGREIVFEPQALERCATGLEEMDSLTVEASCYTAPDFAVEPGATYTLRVRTPAGEVVEGRTMVPGDFFFRLPAVSRGTTCSLHPNTLLPLVWSTSRDAWVYITDLKVFGLSEALPDLGIDSIPEPLELTGLSLSEQDTTLVLPTEIGIFQRGRYGGGLLQALQNGFPEGVRLELAVAAADRNFVNAVRGGTFNPSGDVRFSSVRGDGVGLFGSVVVRSIGVRVEAEPYNSPLCQ